MNKIPQTELYVPINLIFYAVQNKLIPHLKLYLYLKCNSDGIVKDEQANWNNVARVLMVTDKTVRTHLKRLCNLNWIGVLKPSNLCLVRSFDKVCRRLNLYSRPSIIFCTDYFNSFEGFIGGAIFTHFYQASKKTSQRRVVAILGTTKVPARGSFLGYPVSIYGVAKCLKISVSKTYRLKASAIKQGFIQATSDFERLPFKPHYLKTVHKVNYPRATSFVFSDKESLILKLPDLIKTCLKMASRRK